MQALLYLSPALMDWMVFFVSFAVFYAAGVRGVGMQECGWLGILFQAAYMTSSFVSGHFITQHNARRVLFASTVVCGIASVGVLCSSAFWLLAAGLLMFGASSAWFFNSFQAFMRGEASVGSLKTSVALYSLSWCLGAALGNVTAGWLYQWGVPALILAVVFATAVITFMLTRPLKQPAVDHLAEEPVEHGTRPEYPVSNAYIAIGWLMIFTVTFVQRPLFTFLPPLFASQGISSLWASLPLFMHMAVSAVFGFAMFRFRDYLYRRTPFFIIQGGGVAALFAMWLWPTYWVCFAMLCLLGIYAGFVYYCAVYYSSNSGRRSFNIGVNEALVGFGSIAGIVLGDAWMRHSGSTIDMYLVCGIGLAVSIIAQMAIVFMKRR
ncbi:MAG: MFS transporter [bacterium]